MKSSIFFHKRKAYLGESEIHLLGKKPRIGERLEADFEIKPARNSKESLTKKILSKGLTIVSTLPNIHTNACHYQVLDLENLTKKLIPEAKIFHIASDAKSHWKEVDEIHPDLKAYGFSLYESELKDREYFASAFGVGVEGNARIAHGLFGLYEGVFCAAYIPMQQMGNPDIHYFLTQFLKNLKVNKESKRRVGNKNGI